MTKSDGAEDTIGKWTEPWSRVVSYLASYRGEKFDGLAAAFASVGLGVLAVPVVSTVLFLMFGGEVEVYCQLCLVRAVRSSHGCLPLLVSVTLHGN